MWVCDCECSARKGQKKSITPLIAGVASHCDHLKQEPGTQLGFTGRADHWLQSGALSRSCAARFLFIPCDTTMKFGVQVLKCRMVGPLTMFLTLEECPENLTTVSFMIFNFFKVY